ncbi:lipoprotein signal peptidase [Flavipsychrobacter stenotrophus]|uniref:Lipoprotein signal peptidase n=1 Tax=Flavipsychrobacter stenotrophus TaxID=2077091 RepID=A0A2S7SSA0_9BACT|nr:lipoprotein signal peptidase [Flavipsychrobacter stenotrophus]PQJ09780.1 lipoprotein signal peptidase [Flavipsychrobacter stenotrophus]
MKYRNAIILVMLIIIADQLSKIYIKIHFCNGDDVKIFGSWFRLHFIENEGMAYGLKISESVIGKLLLSSFRLIAVIFGFYLLKRLIVKGYKKGVIICGSLILAGALGNLIDSLFYGQIFTDSPYSCFSGYYENISSMLANHNKEYVAHFTQYGHGYGKFLQGKVVDMLYFPMVDMNMPKWVPFLGGKNFVFFEPVFNIADAAISVGVVTLVLFQKSLLTKTEPAPTVTTLSEEV